MCFDVVSIESPRECGVGTTLSGESYEQEVKAPQSNSFKISSTYISMLEVERKIANLNPRDRGGEYAIYLWISPEKNVAIEFGNIYNFRKCFLRIINALQQNFA